MDKQKLSSVVRGLSSVRSLCRCLIVALALSASLPTWAGEDTAIVDQPSLESKEQANDMVNNPRKGRSPLSGSSSIPAILGLTTNQLDFGSSNDFFVPGDYDGDGKTDPAVWRAGVLGVAAFYILQSSDQTVKTNIFGQTGDDPSIIGDYDGDGKVDPAVYRSGVLSGDPSLWIYQSSLAGGATVPVVWGKNGDFPAPGDYDGDGKNDFSVQRNVGGGMAAFLTKLAAGGTTSNNFGGPTEVIVPGDYDGDGKTDIATVHGVAGSVVWTVMGSLGVTFSNFFGNSATDFITQGDYNGDGKTDLSVWRSTGTNFVHFVPIHGTNADLIVTFGKNGDYPVANYNTH